jgi:hypothetical protein
MSLQPIFRLVNPPWDMSHAEENGHFLKKELSMMLCYLACVRNRIREGFQGGGRGSEAAATCIITESAAKDDDCLPGLTQDGKPFLSLRRCFCNASVHTQADFEYPTDDHAGRRDAGTTPHLARILLNDAKIAEPLAASHGSRVRDDPAGDR